LGLLWLGIGALVLLAIASATPKDHENARAWLKPYERDIGIAAALIWAILILGALFPGKTP
jgi:tryptophan-rich sensory protein